MTIPFFILLIIIVVGMVSYLYFRKEQRKLIPKDKYKDARDEAYQKRKTWFKRLEAKANKTLPALAPLINFNRFLLLFITFLVGLLVTPSVIFIVSGVTLPAALLGFTALLIMFFPISLPMFPNGLIAFIVPEQSMSNYGIHQFIIGWGIYLIIFSLGIFIKNRLVFTIVYFTLIMLLIMNMVGCARVAPEFLSGIN